LILSTGLGKSQLVGQRVLDPISLIGSFGRRQAARGTHGLNRRARLFAREHEEPGGNEGGPSDSLATVNRNTFAGVQGRVQIVQQTYCLGSGRGYRPVDDWKRHVLHTKTLRYGALSGEVEIGFLIPSEQRDKQANALLPETR